MRLPVLQAIWHSHVVNCEGLESESLRALVAVNKISNHLVGIALHPEINIKPESERALENAVRELVVDRETMEELSHEVAAMLKAAT
jgi:hypothetical protein